MGKTIIVGGPQGHPPDAVATPVAARVLSAASAAQRLEKSAAGYRGWPMGGQSCRICAFHRPRQTGGDGCSMVAGSVVPSGWCAVFAEADDPADPD